MPAIVIKAFNGIKPIVSPLLLQPGEAQIAENVQLVSGALVPLRSVSAVRPLTKSSPQTIFRYGDSEDESEYWLEFQQDTDVVNSPIPNDQYRRIYWTDGGSPRYATSQQILSGASYPSLSSPLGIPAPQTAIIASGAEPPDAANSETRAYTYTYVSAYGEEGPAAPPSSLVTIDPNEPVLLQAMSTGVGGEYNLVSKRIYRTSTVGSNAEYQFVAEVPVSDTATTDNKEQAELGEVLLSKDWVPPPAGMRGLKMMANGVAAAFLENTLYLSEPNLPHAWPHKYPVDFRIVGLSTFRQSVAVLTNGYPFLATGVDPGGMSLERLEFPHACLSKKSIVDTGDGCLYAGADGVVSIGANGMRVVSEQLFSREQWQSLNPASMRAFLHNSRYHVLYQDKSGYRGMLVFDFTGQGAVLTTTSLNSSSLIRAGHSDARSDTLYLAMDSEILRYNDSPDPLVALWRSGVYRLIRPVSFSYGMVRASTYPVELRIYADDRQPFVKTVQSNAGFRLPSGFTAQQWQFEVESIHEVSMVAVATSAAELQSMT
jgi:hypothetical protein